MLHAPLGLRMTPCSTSAEPGQASGHAKGSRADAPPVLHDPSSTAGAAALAHRSSAPSPPRTAQGQSSLLCFTASGKVFSASSLSGSVGAEQGTLSGANALRELQRGMHAIAPDTLAAVTGVHSAYSPAAGSKLWLMQSLPLDAPLNGMGEASIGWQAAQPEAGNVEDCFVDGEWLSMAASSGIAAGAGHSSDVSAGWQRLQSQLHAAARVLRPC